MRKINHRDLELNIGEMCHCDDYLKLKIVGYYSLYNNIAIAQRRGVDRFIVVPRERKSDLSDAILLDSRYLVIGEMEDIDTKIFNTCVLQNKADNWLEIPNSLYVTRILIAGAVRIIAEVNKIPRPLLHTQEYKQAHRENRIIEVVC